MKRKEWMIAPTHTHIQIRYLLEDLRILHVGVFSSSSLFNVLLNISVYTYKVSQETSRFLFFSLSLLLMRLPTINLLHCRSNDPCRHYQQQRQ